MIALFRVLELAPYCLYRNDHPMAEQLICQPFLIPVTLSHLDPSTLFCFRPAPLVDVLLCVVGPGFLARLLEQPVWRLLPHNVIHPNVIVAMAARGQPIAARGQHVAAMATSGQHSAIRWARVPWEP